MSSFNFRNAPVRPKGDVGGVEFNPASGVDDPQSCDAGRSLMRFFEQKTGGERLVKRSDFTPRDIQPYITNIFLFDVVYGENGEAVDAIVRLMGSALVTFFGEYTGKSILSHPSSASERFLKTMQLTVEHRCNIIGRAEQNEPSKPYYKIESLSVPISDDGTLINKMLVHLQLYSSIGKIEEPDED